MDKSTKCLDLLLKLKAGEAIFPVKDCHYEVSSLIAIGTYEGRDYKLTIEPIRDTESN